MKNLVLLLFIIFSSSNVYAENVDEKSITYDLSAFRHQNDNYVLSSVSIPYGWKIYSNVKTKNTNEFKIDISGESIEYSEILWPKSLQEHKNGSLGHYFINKVNIPIKLIIKNYDSDINFHFDFVMCKDKCILVDHNISKKFSKVDFTYNNDFLAELNIPNSNKTHVNFIIILTAFFGGLILNFMPCVLPVLSIKLISIVKNYSNDRKTISKNFLASSLGIIISFLMIAIFAIVSKALGQNIGLGMYFQNSSFIIFICLVITFFISNLQDNFSINLPSKFINKLSAKQNNNSLYFSFFDGILATLLATPCSAPLVGTSLSFAFTQNNYVILFIFLLMGIGFATPYILVAIFPSSIRFLPKPGLWMNNLKKLLGILLILTLLWLVYIFTSQVGIIAGILLFMICILLKFFIERPIKINVFIAIIICISAFIIPKITDKNFEFFQKFTSGVWQEFDKDKIQYYIKQDKIIVVDITASWCPTCQFNKLRIFSKPKIVKLLSDSKIIAMRGDLSSPNESITKYVNSYNRWGIPFNIVYGPSKPEGIILPEILTEQALIDAISKSGL